MIMYPTEYNEKGVGMYQTCNYGYEGHTHKCCSSIMRSKWGGGGVWRGAKSAHAILEQTLRVYTIPHHIYTMTITMLVLVRTM